MYQLLIVLPRPLLIVPEKRKDNHEEAGEKKKNLDIALGDCFQGQWIKSISPNRLPLADQPRSHMFFLLPYLVLHEALFEALSGIQLLELSSRLAAQMSATA